MPIALMPSNPGPEAAVPPVKDRMRRKSCGHTVSNKRDGRDKRKLENFHFDRKYFVIAVNVLLITSFITSLILYTAVYSPPEDSWMYVLCTSISFGWTFNDIFNQGIKFKWSWWLATPLAPKPSNIEENSRNSK